MSFVRRRVFSASLITSVLLTSAPALVLAQAQAFPNKPIRIIVPYPAGGATDVAARLLAPRLQEELKQNVIVENKPGASGNLGMQSLMQSPADGHTLAMSLTGMLSVNPVTYTKAGFTAADFVPVARVSLAPLVLVVPAASPWKTVGDLVAAGKAAGKDGLPYGSAGAGGLSHLASELLNANANGNYTHVPYKGGAATATAVLGGEATTAFNTIETVLPLIRAKRLRALAVSTRERSPALPDVPTALEAGIKNYEALGWFGLMAPAGTPQAIIGQLSSEITKAMATPAIRERALQEGATPVGSTPAQFERFVRDEIAKWTRIIADAGIKLE